MRMLLIAPVSQLTIPESFVYQASEIALPEVAWSCGELPFRSKSEEVCFRDRAANDFLRIEQQGILVSTSKQDARLESERREGRSHEESTNHAFSDCKEAVVHGRWMVVIK